MQSWQLSIHKNEDTNREYIINAIQNRKQVNGIIQTNNNIIPMP